MGSAPSPSVSDRRTSSASGSAWGGRVAAILVRLRTTSFPPSRPRTTRRRSSPAPATPSKRWRPTVSKRRNAASTERCSGPGCPPAGYAPALRTWRTSGTKPAHSRHRFVDSVTAGHGGAPGGGWQAGQYDGPAGRDPRQPHGPGRHPHVHRRAARRLRGGASAHRALPGARPHAPDAGPRLGAGAAARARGAPRRARPLAPRAAPRGRRRAGRCRRRLVVRGPRAGRLPSEQGRHVRVGTGPSAAPGR